MLAMDGQEPTFRELIRLAKSGDKGAFDTLYHRHVTPVYRYVYIRMRSKEDAEDIVQEAFLKAYEALPGYEARGGSFLPFLFTVARNLLINHSKKKRPIATENEIMDREDSGERTSRETEMRELRESLADAMETLTETEREVVELKFFAERSYTEIAEALGKREDAIRQHVARSMKKMRVYMRQKNNDQIA